MKRTIQMFLLAGFCVFLIWLIESGYWLLFAGNIIGGLVMLLILSLGNISARADLEAEIIELKKANEEKESELYDLSIELGKLETIKTALEKQLTAQDEYYNNKAQRFNDRIKEVEGV